MSKINFGCFFEDYCIGDVICYVILCIIVEGECVLYYVLYLVCYVLYFLDEFVVDCGLDGSLMDDLIVFYMVFGCIVFDISLNVVVNLGYVEGCWLVLVWFGDMLCVEFEVIGFKENLNGKLGVVWVCMCGINQMDLLVLEYVCWVMVCKVDFDVFVFDLVVLDLVCIVDLYQLIVFEGLDFSNYDD